MSEALKPCPWCGEDVAIHTTWNEVLEGALECENCGACTFESFDAWNGEMH